MTTTSSAEAAPPRPRRKRPRELWVGLAIGLVLGLLPVVVLHTPWIQSHLITSDDRSLGLALYEPPSAASAASKLQVTQEDRERIARCQRFALNIYHHPIPALEVKPFPGWATPAEKAFYGACVGGPKAGPYGGD